MTTNRRPDLLAQGQEPTSTRNGEPRRSIPDTAQPGGHIVVRLPAEIDITNASEVHSRLAQALTNGAALVIADATETTFCDCAGIRALMAARRQAGADGARLRVAAGDALRRMLSLTETDHMLDLYPTLAAARTTQPAAPAEQPADIGEDEGYDEDEPDYAEDEADYDEDEDEDEDDAEYAEPVRAGSRRTARR
jgi:anti-anti-sigma factor